MHISRLQRYADLFPGREETRSVREYRDVPKRSLSQVMPKNFHAARLPQELVYNAGFSLQKAPRPL